MIPIHEDLSAVLAAVRVESRSSYRIFDWTRHLEQMNTRGADSSESATVFVDTLTDDLYSRLYCQPVQAVPLPPIVDHTVRDHMRLLSESNCGQGTWEAG